MDNVAKGPWQKQRPSFEEFSPFSPVAWQGVVAPPYDWIVDGAFLRGTVAILSGDGGLGKSLLLQQLVTASALGRSWLGMKTAKCRSLAVFCEDDRDELQRRQEAINAHYGAAMKDLAAIAIESRAGRDSVLMNFPRWGGDGIPTTMFEQLRFAAKEHGAQIVVLDTVADVFSGNEVDRNQPRTFIRALRKLALELQGVVILTQHPSVDGLNNGTGRSGSTGWNNSVRSRLYLTLPPKKKAADGNTAQEEPTNERRLKTMKNNHAAAGGWLQLRWSRGVFERVEDEAEPSRYYTRD